MLGMLNFEKVVSDPPGYMKGGDELTRYEFILVSIFSFAMSNNRFNKRPDGDAGDVMLRVYQGLICGVRGEERCDDGAVDRAFVQWCVANGQTPDQLLKEWAEQEGITLGGD